MKNPELVYLEWEDAVSNAAWFEEEEVEAWSEDASGWLIKECGWLIKETGRYLIIATSWKPEDRYVGNKYCNLHKIPKTWVRKRVDLTKLVDLEK